MSHKRFLVELEPEERTYLKQLTSSGSPRDAAPAAGPDLAALRPGAGGPGLDRRTRGGGRGRDRHDRVPGAARPWSWRGWRRPCSASRARRAPPKLDGGGRGRAGAAGLFDAAAGPRARWTLKLLCRELVALEVVDSIAPETVRRALKKTR